MEGVPAWRVFNVSFCATDFPAQPLDSDGDGLLDSYEGLADVDGDGAPPPPARVRRVSLCLHSNLWSAPRKACCCCGGLEPGPCAFLHSGAACLKASFSFPV